jgi:radical SAM superfamily enzyme YgiQ (UPF0313 family)
MTIILTNHPKSGVSLNEKKIYIAAERLRKNKIKRILFIQPPDLDGEKFSTELAVNKRYWNYPPYGLLILASIGRDHGCEVKCANLQDSLLSYISNQDPKQRASFNYQQYVDKEIRNLVEDFNPDIIGITCMFSVTHPSFVNVINVTRRYTKVPIALGGVHVTNAYSDITTRGAFLKEVGAADFLFLREADVSFAGFINFANEGGDFPGQVAVKCDDRFHEIYTTTVPSEGQTNTIPAYDLSPPTDLSRVGRIGTFEAILPEGTKIATALFNRGCRAECTFCSVRNFNGRGVRGREISSVVEELKILKYEYGINHVMWLDDDLLFDRRKSIALFNSMVKENLNMTWDTTNGVIAASCTDEVISAASASGCIGMILGMESGNDKILKEIKKPGNVRHFLRAAEVLRNYPQINTRVFVMIGFPRETFAQMKESFEVVKEMDVDWANINILQPLPNTPIFDEMVRSGMIDPKTMKFDEVSFSLGSSGKLSGRRLGGKDMLAESFEEVFSSHDPDAVPLRSELDDIWAYMNFHLNFRRLDSITDPHKLKIQYAWLTSICDLLAPTNAFAKYYKCKLELNLFGEVSERSFEDLTTNLALHPYWTSRFLEFSLSSSDFEK